MPLPPHDFWQSFTPAGSHDEDPVAGFAEAYPARMPDGRQLLLPIRTLPGDGDAGVASLILNQASFVVEEGLAEAAARLVAPLAVEVVVGVPTLGLTLAASLARRLGHTRYVPLGTSRKFWYSEALSEPVASITSPGAGKALYLDPRLLPLLEGRRVLLVDDVVSTGASMAAALRLLAKAGVEPVGIAAAMAQSRRWAGRLGPMAETVRTPLRSPLLKRGDNGNWTPAEEHG